MANQTVTTVVNYDDASISGLNNGETITINGGSVTIDSDVRWAQQEAVFGAVTISATQGGSFLFDGTKVWEIPFSASSGNVPTLDTLGSNGVTGGTSGATGELLRVWGTSLTPETAGGAMPATGWIKLRSKSGDFQNGETITLPGGATITASGPGKRSWIHIVGRAVSTGAGSRLTIPRLGTHTANGDWYELGTTDGNDDQTFQYPVTDLTPAIWIETAPDSGVYEIYLYTDRWNEANITAEDERGKFFGMDAATGVITIARRTGSGTAGFKPPSGCKVRIPNVILSMANGTAGTWQDNFLPTTVPFRYGYTTTSSGSVIYDKVSSNWLFSTSAAFAVEYKNCAISGAGAFTNTGTTVVLENVGISSTTNVSATQLTITTSYGGGSLTDVFVRHRVGTSGGQTIALTDVADFTLTRVKSQIQEAYVANHACFTLARCSDTIVTDCVAIGGIGFACLPVFGFTCTGFQYASRSFGTTTTAQAAVPFSFTAGSTDIFVEGFSNFAGIANVHPYANIVTTATGVDGFEMRNIGTPSAPYNMGTANACGLIYIGTASRNVVLRRLYTQNTRTAAYTAANTVQGFDVYNVWGDANDNQATISAINGTMRGCRYRRPTAGGAAVYGTHWMDAFTGTDRGVLVISANEPTDQTTDQCTFTLDAAQNSGFTSTGNVSMGQLTDEVVWTMPYYALGHKGIGQFTYTANNAATWFITGTNPQNHEFEYQIDKNDGNGFNGTYKHLVNVGQRSADGNVGTNTVTITVADMDALITKPQVGWYVQGEAANGNVPSGTTITNITGADNNVLTLSNNITTAFGANALIYFWKDIADETIDENTGYKLKVRGKVNTAVATNALTFLTIPIDTDATAQQIAYPLPTIQNIGTVTNIRAGSRIRVYNVTTETEIANEIVSGTTWTYNYDEGDEFSNGDIINIRLARCLGATASIGYEGATVANSNGWSLFADQNDDLVYNTNGIDGTTVDEFVFDYPNVEVDIDDPDGTTSITRLYAWWANERTTEDGIRVLIGGIIAEDEANYKIITSKIDLKLDNLSNTGVQFTGDLRLYRDDGLAPVVDSTTGGGSITLYAGKVYTVAVGSGVTNQDKVDIINGVSAELTPIKKNTDLIPGTL